MIKLEIEYYKIKKNLMDYNMIQNICNNILTDYEYKDATITIIFSNDIELSHLKKKYFGKDDFTDTISFNLEEDNEPIEGEIYISIDRVIENAQKYNEDFITECKRVIIHGCLHLLGFEDESQDGKNKMNNLENIYLRKSEIKIL